MRREDGGGDRGGWKDGGFARAGGLSFVLLMYTLLR
jgi:hypothetical protein